MEVYVVKMDYLYLSPTKGKLVKHNALQKNNKEMECFGKSQPLLYYERVIVTLIGDRHCHGSVWKPSWRVGKHNRNYTESSAYANPLSKKCVKLVSQQKVILLINGTRQRFPLTKFEGIGSARKRSLGF